MRLCPVRAVRYDAGEGGAEQLPEAAAEQGSEDRRRAADEGDLVPCDAGVQAAGEAECRRRKRDLEFAPTAGFDMSHCEAAAST